MQGIIIIKYPSYFILIFRSAVDFNLFLPGFTQVCLMMNTKS